MSHSHAGREGHITAGTGNKTKRAVLRRRHALQTSGTTCVLTGKLQEEQRRWGEARKNARVSVTTTQMPRVRKALPWEREVGAGQTHRCSPNSPDSGIRAVVSAPFRVRGASFSRTLCTRPAHTTATQGRQLAPV